ncbi:cell wall-binding repeat-containing protein [Schumannella luteola]
MTQQPPSRRASLLVTGALAVACLTLSGAPLALAADAPLGSISGTLDVPDGHGQIILYDAATDVRVDVGSHQLDGSYIIPNVPAGSYHVGFSAWTDRYNGAIPKVPEFWNDVPTIDQAAVITVAPGQAVTGIDASLADDVPSIIGKIDAPGIDFERFSRQQHLVVMRPDGTSVPTTQTWVDPDGNYRVWGVEPGTYIMMLAPDGPPAYARTYSGNTPARSEAAVLTVTDGETTVVPPIVPPLATALSGVVTIEHSGTMTSGFSPVVQLYWYSEASDDFIKIEGGYIDQDSWYADGLWPGRYMVRFADAGTAWVGPEWWPDARLEDDAEEIVLSPGESRTDIDASFELYTFYRERIAGVDRFATNVEMSSILFPEEEGPHSIPVLYIANGLNFPDALSAGPAAAHLGGELLLVTPTSIPAVIRAEIVRLNPERIVVVGGTPSVSAEVYSQLAALTDRIERQAGVDRYATSRIVVEKAFGCEEVPCAETVLLATGANFPDALSAGPAAAELDSPVLLVNGASSSVDLPTRQLLDSLGIESAIIAGDVKSVTAGVESAIVDMMSGAVHRFSGSDRYDTATRINNFVFDTTPYAFLASGGGFADALSGGPLAAHYGAPLYLAPPSCIPNYVIASMTEREIDLIGFFGSEASLSSAAWNLTLC